MCKLTLIEEGKGHLSIKSAFINLGFKLIYFTVPFLKKFKIPPLLILQKFHPNLMFHPNLIFHPNLFSKIITQTLVQSLIN